VCSRGPQFGDLGTAYPGHTSNWKICASLLINYHWSARYFEKETALFTSVTLEINLIFLTATDFSFNGSVIVTS
jgi:hypothetical protein